MRGAYRYNGLGQRVEKTSGGISTRFVYGINGELLSELDSAGNPQRDYVTVDGEPLAVITYTVQQSGLGTDIDNGEAGTASTGTWTITTDNKNTQWAATAFTPGMSMTTRPPRMSLTPLSTIV